MANPARYHALCVEDEDGSREIAFLHLRDDPELGRLLALAVYTTREGEAQRRDLGRYDSTGVAPVGAENLLDAVQQGYPTSVYLDGHKLAGSVFLGLLKEELGLPIRHPRMVRLEDPPPREP